MSLDAHHPPSMRSLRALIWVYIILLLVEGALRRWVFPGLSGPLLVIRDPVAVAILTLAWRANILRKAGLMWSVIVFALISFVLSLAFGHGKLAIALFGVRIFAIHFPLIYVIGRVFNLIDVLKVGRIFAMVSIPMTTLVAAQFFLPQTHRINVGIGGQGTAGFDGAEGYFRPPGTFSFTSGLAEYYSLLGCFLLGFALLRGAAHRKWWIAAVVCTVLAVPLSISRGLLLHLGVSLVFFVLAAMSNRNLLSRLVKNGLIGVTVVVLAMWVPSFRYAMIAFSSRWNAASEVEGGVHGVVVDRFLGGLWSAITNLGDVPIVGFGIGLGTNAGAQLLTGERAFLVAEGEWLRLVGEMGPVIGMVMIVLRVIVAVGIFMRARDSARNGNGFPLVLSSVACIWTAQGVWAQPTSLGFGVIAAGFALASCKYPRRPLRVKTEHAAVS